MSTEDAWLSTDEVAARLKIPAKTLAVWASTNRGPKYARIGRYRRYRFSDLLLWEQEQIESSARRSPNGPGPAAKNSGRHPSTRKTRDRPR